MIISCASIRRTSMLHHACEDLFYRQVLDYLEVTTNRIDGSLRCNSTITPIIRNGEKEGRASACALYAVGRHFARAKPGDLLAGPDSPNIT